MNLELIMGGLLTALAIGLYLSLALTIRSLRKERENDRTYIADLQNRFMAKSYDEFRVWSPPPTPKPPPVPAGPDLMPVSEITEDDMGRIVGEETPVNVRG